jgi:methionyl-tRNA formyltransferase
MNIVFFGSTDDSVIVLETLHQKHPVSAVVTQPAKPVGRKKIFTPTPVELWAKTKKIPILTFPQDPQKPWLFEHEDDVTNAVSSFHPDLIVTACFGERIPDALIKQVPHGGVNVHPSLLPRWRGAYPVPWAIMSGDTQTGVTISTLTVHFDDGRILSQKKIPLTPKDLPDDIRKKLFTMGATLLVATLPDYLSGKNKGIEQRKEDVTTARRLTRDDGYIPWELITNALHGIDIPRDSRSGMVQNMLVPLSEAIIRLHRALTPWPGIWTKISIHGIEKRVKIRETSMDNAQLSITSVQLEGKQPVDWKTFASAYLPS